MEAWRNWKANTPMNPVTPGGRRRWWREVGGGRILSL